MRYVPSATAAGRNVTTSESVALMTVIGSVSHQTCGARDPNALPRIVSVWFTRSTAVLSTTSGSRCLFAEADSLFSAFCA
jgi:hypothetical protein